MAIMVPEDFVILPGGRILYKCSKNYTFNDFIEWLTRDEPKPSWRDVEEERAIEFTWFREMCQKLIERGPKPTVPEVQPLATFYRSLPGNEGGGSLRSLLENGEANNDSIKFCREWALERKDEPGMLLSDVLMKMSKTQRSRIV